jgi:hypothetical protein
MTVIAESKSEILAFKEYADPTINDTTEPLPATDPGATDAQILRHTTHGMNYAEDQYRPNEKRQDAQTPMGAGGSGVVTGPINGYLSAGTHARLFAGVFRNEWEDVVSVTEADLTSIAFAASDSSITFGGGDPVAEGLRVGMYIKAAGITGPNLNKKFLILAFSTGSNRKLTVYPAPADLTADTAFTVTSAGKTLINPATGLTSFKYAFEWYNPEADFSRFASECRMGGFDLGSPVNANPTLNFNVMGRKITPLSGASAPFFTAPNAETDTDIPSSMAGLVHLNGSTIAVSTASTLKVDLKPSAAKTKNDQNLVAAIFLDDFMGTGDLTAFVNGSTLYDAYRSKTEMKFFQHFPSNAAMTDAQCFFAPRMRLTSCNEVELEGGKAFQCGYEIARYFGSEPGIESTTLQIADTAVV